LFINVVGLAPSAVQNAPLIHIHDNQRISFEFRAKALMPFILAHSVSSSAAVLSQSADEVIE
jgi:hypothetical protein